MDDIEGRIEDILNLPGTASSVNVHPIVFNHVLDQAALVGCQAIQDPSELRVLSAGAAPGRRQGPFSHLMMQPETDTEFSY